MKKGKKRAATKVTSNAVASGSKDGTAAVAIDDDVWSIPSDDGAAAPAGEKPGKAQKTSSSDPAAAAAGKATKLGRRSLDRLLGLCSL